ncbi:hypothetical protein [Sinomonas sp. P10A9]|uniref:Uncharacterized protein n=1 Tax=Sinomonas puerhi TaxID=3238584 RepID=A0AB39L3H1_9MICC
MSPLELVRAAYGATELLAPGAVERLLLGSVPDARARTVVRILGARHLAQALVTARAGAGMHRLGGAVDAVHALTMAAVAALDPKRRRAAAVNAALALVFAAGEFR